MMSCTIMNQNKKDEFIDKCIREGRYSDIEDYLDAELFLGNISQEIYDTQITIYKQLANEFAIQC